MREIWQDTWFEHWFKRKGDLLHCRFIEYAWILRHLSLQDGGSVLDVGCGGSFFPLMLALQGFDVTAVDSHPFDYGFKHYSFVQGNAATVKLPKKYNRIIMISALEHFGLQNGRCCKDLGADLKAIENLTKYLEDDGFWMITVPMGKEKVLGEFRVYTQHRLNALFPKIVTQDYFVRKGKGFEKSTWKAIRNVVHKHRQGDRTVTCLVAKK